MDDDLTHIDVPNCPECLEPMQPVVGAWFCPGCQVWVRPDD